MIKRGAKSEARILAELAIQMWSDHTIPDLEKKFETLTQSDQAVCFLKYVDNTAVGFAQCQIRTDYVEGTETSPVGYLEGIFIVETYRHKGYAKELLVECEKWAKEKKCSEFASDCELDNLDSFRFHMAMGFEEANRIICFRKNL
ncbi:MAG: aminoglycoside 6'-N-acetyltransferase [Faecousia sp.]